MSAPAFEQADSGFQFQFNWQNVTSFLLGVIKTLRLALPKLGIGWMFALLTINFNRITIVELGVTAILVTALLSMHYFLSPFQVISGRIADRHPILGYRRTPYMLLSGVLASAVFVLLPSAALGMSAGAPLAFALGLILFVLFGIAIAVNGASHHALIAESTRPRARGGVMAVVQTVTIMSTIFAAAIMNSVMPAYNPETMQYLYNLTPFIVIGSILLGVVGLEKRLNADEINLYIEKAKQVAPTGNPLAAARQILSENEQARGFFFFVFIAIFAIFLQDNILEVFGAEVFGLSLEETTKFQPTWGGGVLIGMAIMGVISVIGNISKRKIVLIGAVGTSLGMGAMMFASLLGEVAVVTPALVFMGFFTGFFNVGALAMMMDMTVEGATGLYMGLWGMAQAFGNGLASLGSGALHTGLIETGLFAPASAYGLIFGIEAVGMIAAAAIMWRLSVKNFHKEHQASLERADMTRALEVGAVG